MSENQGLNSRLSIDQVLSKPLPIPKMHFVLLYGNNLVRESLSARHGIASSVNKDDLELRLGVIENYFKGASLIREESVLNEEKLRIRNVFSLLLRSTFCMGANGPLESEYWKITTDERFRYMFGDLNSKAFGLLAQAVPLLGNDEANNLVREEFFDLKKLDKDKLDQIIPQVEKIFSARGAKLDEANKIVLNEMVGQFTRTNDEHDPKKNKWRKRIIKQAKILLD